jgi:hypothetical protein
MQARGGYLRMCCTKRSLVSSFLRALKRRGFPTYRILPMRLDVKVIYKTHLRSNYGHRKSRLMDLVRDYRIKTKILGVLTPKPPTEGSYAFPRSPLRTRGLLKLSDSLERISNGFYIWEWYNRLWRR